MEVTCFAPLEGGRLIPTWENMGWFFYVLTEALRLFPLQDKHRNNKHTKVARK